MNAMCSRLPVRAVMVLSLMGILAACGIESAPLPTREAEHISASGLAEEVAESLAGVGLDGSDLDGSDGGEDGLRLYSRGNLLLLLGTVDSDSPSHVYDALKDSPGIRVVVLVNVPGSADDEANLKLGRMLRQAGISTYLPARGLVASGGVDLLLSGARRIVERGAMVGVHSWADSDGSSGDAIPREHPHHRLYLEYYQEMGVTQEFYWFTLGAAPPEGMHWMTEAEMERYEIFTELR